MCEIDTIVSYWLFQRRPLLKIEQGFLTPVVDLQIRLKSVV